VGKERIVMKSNTLFISALFALVLAVGTSLAVSSGAGKDPACVKKCGEKPKADSDACATKGRACLVACGVKEKVAWCAVGCLTTPEPASCFVLCSLNVSADCIAPCVDQMTACQEEALKSNSRCLDACPAK
jgi:hypothetical protein